MKKCQKLFLESELKKYEELLEGEEPGTEDYKKIYNLYMDTLKELYPKKNLWDKIIDVSKIVVPVGASIFLGTYAYHKNSELESKDGDTWREATRLR